MKAKFIDTNIFMYAAGEKHEYKEPSLRVLAAIRDGKLTGAIDGEVIKEILYRYSYLGLPGVALELAWKTLDLPLDILNITKEDSKMSLYIYGKYRDQGVEPRDALHVAVMLNNEISEIISADTHFDVIGEVKRIDPKNLSV
jgi:hypothetical protein